MTDTTTEAVERTHRIYINRAMVFDAGVTWTTVDGLYPHAYVPEEAYRALLADRDRLASLLAASQSPDPVTNADSCQLTRTYEDGVWDAAAVAYRICAETRHVTLGQKAETSILELIKEKSHE